MEIGKQYSTSVNLLTLYQLRKSMNNENLEVYPLFAKTIVRTQVDLEGTDLSKIEWAQNYQNEISTSQACT